MLLKHYIQDKNQDVRLLEKNLSQGKMTREEFSKMQADLPDLENQLSWLDKSVFATRMARASLVNADDAQSENSVVEND